MFPCLRHAVALGMAGAVAACSSLGTPPPPGGPTPVSGGWAQPAPAGGVALAQWWQSFGDSTLVDLVAQAAQANTSIAVARANLREARAVRTQAAASLWPGLSGALTAQRQAGGGSAARNQFGLGLDASWELDLFGAARSSVAAQDAQVRASAANLASIQVSVAAELALAYLQLRAGQARLAVARGNLAGQEETWQIARWREQAGLASSIEVEQARGAVEQTRAQVPALQSAVAQSSHAIAVLTGQPPAALQQRLQAAAPLPQPQTALAVAIPARVLAQRPDVAAAEHQLRAAAQRLAQADAERKPSLRLSASLAWSALTLGGVGSVGAARSLVAQLGQPLFDAGRRDAVLAQRQAQFDAADAGYRAQVLTALQDVDDALASLAAGRERVAALLRAQEAAGNAALLAALRYRGGLADFQTVLDTQRTQLNVQDSLVNSQAELASAHVRLYKALGGGWQPADPETAS